MTMTPNRIVLIARGRYDEAKAVEDCYPGMVLRQDSNNSVRPHDQAGGGGPLLLAIEDALRGGTINQVLPSKDNIPFYRPARGDLFCGLLRAGYLATSGQDLISYGDGTLIPLTPTSAYAIGAPSTVVTNTATETTFSNGSYAIPLNSLNLGDVVRIHAKVNCLSVNSTNTHQEKLYIGATVLCDSGPLPLTAGDYVMMDLSLTVQAIGATGSFVASGSLQYSVQGNVTVKSITVPATAIDTTAAETVAIKSTASVANANNQVQLAEYTIGISHVSSVVPLLRAFETYDNTLGVGTSMFPGIAGCALVRCIVP